eukprot:TRINITY_DN36779_c0_g2_i1.p1 TRINITY_DN36779_c0_g2~~TRINITY_DN36779_c0_g2_i1.p1  ORF type:complete len:873 (+),score=180.04 TRINITY_DN36779_c0_g2_i1:175-2793(+)
MGCGCLSHHQVGFPRAPREFLYAATDKEFVRSLDKEELKDKRLLLEYFRLEHEGHFVVTDAFRDLVRRKGLPQRYRWRGWRALTGWSVLYRPGEYERIITRVPDSKTQDAIEKDLDRTFPSIEEFCDVRKRELAKMLRAHASVFPKVGYCQGMNFVAGFILLAAGTTPDSPKDAFFLLLQMMVKYRANLLFCDGLPLLKLHTFQFCVLLEKLLPDVHRHFEDTQITPELYLTKWILTLFTQPLPFDSAARVWDLIICDGLQALVLVALAVIKLRRTRLLREDTEGILELLNFRDGEQLSGGDIVKTALSLEAQLPPGSLSDGMGIRPSKLFLEWEDARPSEVADYRRAEAEVCAVQPDWHGSGSDNASEGLPVLEAARADESRNSAENVESHLPDLPAQDAVISQLGAPGPGSVDGAGPGASEVPAESGSKASPHVVAAEAKVAVNPSMPVRKPGRPLSKSSAGKRGSGTDVEKGRSSGTPKRSSSLGCLERQQQSGGSLLSEEDVAATWSPSKAKNGAGAKKSEPAAEARREEAAHPRRGQNNGGRDSNAGRGLKAAGSPPAPAPDVRRSGGRGAAPMRSLSNSSLTSGVRSRSGADLEVADEHGGLEGKSVPCTRKSRTNPALPSGNRAAASPAMSSREIDEDLSMHGKTWPMQQIAGLIGGSVEQAGNGNGLTAPPAPQLTYARARSRGDSIGPGSRGSSGGPGARSRGESAGPGSRGHSSERSAVANKTSSPGFGGMEERRVRSLSPHGGERPSSPLDASRTQGHEPLEAPSAMMMIRSEGNWQGLHHAKGDAVGDQDAEEEEERGPPGFSPQKKKNKKAWDTPAPSAAWGSPQSSHAKSSSASLVDVGLSSNERVAAENAPVLRETE